jgi:CBS domain-containing protein
VKNILVKDVMSKNLILFRPKETIHDVMIAFIKYKISGGPVVDKYGELMGIISEADCMKEISESRYFNMPILDKTVYHFMTKNVETIEASTSIFDAASLFSKTNRRRFPVIDKKRLVGQVSRKDIVIAAINLKSQTW